MKIMKILYYENMELYGSCVCMWCYKNIYMHYRIEDSLEIEAHSCVYQYLKVYIA